VEVIIGNPYLEPTQWCVDVWIDGGPKQQLTAWPPGHQPSTEEVQAVVDAYVLAIQCPYTIEGEGGEIVSP
jgi:hypothetical protein